MKALKDIDYQGPLTLEPVPPHPSPLLAVNMERYLPLRDLYAEDSIAALRGYEETTE
jgi:hypothetical protein